MSNRLFWLCGAVLLLLNGFFLLTTQVIHMAVIHGLAVLSLLYSVIVAFLDSLDRDNGNNDE
jgi:hypothetical protein